MQPQASFVEDSMKAVHHPSPSNRDQQTEAEHAIREAYLTLARRMKRILLAFARSLNGFWVH